MEALIKYIAKEGRVISEAPAAFFIVLTLSVGIAWGVMNWGYSSRYEGQSSAISSLEGRLKLKEDQLSDYKDKLNGATPEDAKKRIEALELQVNSISPRRVTENQKATLLDSIRNSKGIIWISQDLAASDSGPYASALAAVFQAAGWDVVLPILMGPSNTPPSGLGLRVVDPNNLRPLEQQIFAALNKSGIKFDLQGGLEDRRPRFNRRPGTEIPIEHKTPDIDIIISNKTK